MRRALVVTALSTLCGLAGNAVAQNPGETPTDFEKKKGGSTKMHRLASVPANQTEW